MNNKVKELEDILGVKLEPYEYEKREKNSYRIYKQFNQGKDIHELYLNNIHIESFNNANNIFRLTIKDTTISSLSELLKIKNLYKLTLENVIFEDFDTKIITNDTLKEIVIRNTDFNAVSVTKCTEVKFAFFTNCKIDFSYSVNELPKLYQLEFDNCNLEKLEDSKNSSLAIKHQWLRISNMNFENINSFICFQETKNITLINCNIKSISDLYLFEKLDSFHIDSNTNIENTTKTTHKHQNIYCEILQNEQVINLKNLFPIIHYIDKLHFENLKVDRLDFIENFKNVEHLSFEKSDVHLDSFLDISSKIETLNIEDSTFKKTKYLDKFTKLHSIKTNSGETGIYSLTELLPLKHQLKSFISFDDELKDGNVINQFKNLELLQLSGIEFRGLKEILSLENLKHLYLGVYLDDSENISTINLKNLKSLERLNLCINNVEYIGFEYLTKLKALRVESDFHKINPLAKMEKLERLQFDEKGEITISFNEFPNLKELRIQGDVAITLDLPNLEVLECEYINHFNGFEKMPNLKKLHIKDTDKMPEILTNSPNLTHLQIDELRGDNLEILKPLQKLEYLDFSNEYLDTNESITDIKYLNYLPNLKEVNLFGFEKLESQLKNPEIGVYFGMAQIHFHTYDEDDLWI